MNTRKNLNSTLRQISDLTGEATSKEDAIKSGKDKFLYLEYASCYGGYRLVNVNCKTGAHSGAFGGNGIEGRLNASKMAIKLNSILSGIEAIKNK